MPDPSALTAVAALPGADGAQRVVVVGTGVVGLATALGCAQRGVDVVLVGPAPRLPAAKPAGTAFDARIYAISRGASQLLAEQRVWQQLDVARVNPVARMDVHGDDGGRLQFDALAAGVDRLATICEETELLRVLWLSCSLAPRITHRAANFEGAQFEPGGVQVRLSDGALLPCALLLGADGKQSAVRSAAGIAAHLKAYGHTAFVANFSCERPHHDTAFQWFTDQGIVALLPLPGRNVSLVWSAPTALAPELTALTPEAFASRVQERCGGALGQLQMQGGTHAFPLVRTVVDHLVGPRVALLGDAAHVVHPLAGQGLNLGLQDVSDLLRLLAEREPWRALGDPVWLRRYARARAEPIALMRGTVGSLAWLFGARDLPLQRLRNLGMSAVNAIAPLKNALVQHALG